MPSLLLTSKAHGDGGYAGPPARAGNPHGSLVVWSCTCATAQVLTCKTGVPAWKTSKPPEGRWPKGAKVNPSDPGWVGMVSVHLHSHPMNEAYSQATRQAAKPLVNTHLRGVVNKSMSLIAMANVQPDLSQLRFEGVIHGVDCGCMSLGFLGWRRGG